MPSNLAYGGDLLRFLMEHGYYCANSILGQATVYHREDTHRLKPLTVPTQELIGPGILKLIMEQADLGSNDFWKWMDG